MNSDVINNVNNIVNNKINNVVNANNDNIVIHMNAPAPVRADTVLPVPWLFI